jgi:hypothetical protein
MEFDEAVRNEVKRVFGNTKVKVIVDFLINEDAWTVKLIAETVDGRVPEMTMKLSGLEELQYVGDPIDLMKDKIQDAYFTIKHQVDKEGTKLVEEEHLDAQ